jgi:hypothetical protein
MSICGWIKHSFGFRFIFLLFGNPGTFYYFINTIIFFIQELILGQVDVVTQRDESPFMGKLPIVRKLLDYVEVTW